MTTEVRRVRVQSDRFQPLAGSVSWETHLLAWKGYEAAGHGNPVTGQSAERIAQRGGFSYRELQCSIAGHYSNVPKCRIEHPVPDGWEPRP